MTSGVERLEDLRVHSWHTASLPASTLLELEAEVASAFDWNNGVPIVTCQRYEVVTLSPGSSVAAPRCYAGVEALLHLSRLAAGLESLVLGEAEVLGQVRRALSAAPPDLRRVVIPAITAARVLRREAGFDSHAGYALDAALRHAAVTPRGSLVVVGGGPMGRRIAERAAELGFEVTLVARRKPVLAGNVHYEPFSKLPALPPADVLVTCLGRAAPAMSENDVPPIRTLAIDLGTPRNLQELSVPVVRLADLLEGCRSPDEGARRRDLEERLHAILAAQLALRQPGSPLGALREEVERIRQRELLRSLRLHPELPAEKLDAITRSLVNQIFHRPSLRLRDSEDVDLAEAVAALFQPASREETRGSD